MAIKTLNKAIDICKKEKSCFIISPEGTRRRKKSEEDICNIIPFKKGPFHSAKALNYSILPIMLYGANRSWPTS